MSRERSPVTFLHFDVVLVVCVVALMILGGAFIYSSGVTSTGIQISDEWLKQIVWGSLGLVLMLLFAFLDYRRWKRLAFPIYLGSVVLLVFVLIFGNYVKGARAWLGIGSFGIQPSEFAKIALIILLAAWFDDRPRDLGPVKTWAAGIGLTGLLSVLVLVQPDLGTALVYIPIFLAIALVAGTPLAWWFFPVLSGGITVIGILGIAWNDYISVTSRGLFRIFTDRSIIVVVLPVMLFLCILAVVGWLIFKRRTFLGLLYGFGVMGTGYLGAAAGARALKGYQMMRLVVFLDPQIDPRGAGWHIIQSITAVGSGGLTGKGFLRGTQSHYRYLPEQSTDFIFSILAEEMGFLGGLLVFALFTAILARAIYIAVTAGDSFGTYVATGVAAMMAFHVSQNIGMSIGIMPITGIPLFFLSYGGSSLWTGLIGIGLLLSIHNRRYRH